MAIEHAERARALVGTRFRAQGRGADGLDCVGVVISAFGIDPRRVRRDYSLRRHERREVEQGLAEHFRRVAVNAIRTGDVVLMAVGADRLHLGVRTYDAFVHAHAGIRRVVETPGMPQWPVLSAWRRRTRPRRG
jgi:hypothetical protein